MSKLRPDEVQRWLDRAREERLPPTPPSPAPAQQQHPRNPDVYLEDDPDATHTD